MENEEICEQTMRNNFLFVVHLCSPEQQNRNNRMWTAQSRMFSFFFLFCVCGDDAVRLINNFYANIFVFFSLFFSFLLLLFIFVGNQYGMRRWFASCSYSHLWNSRCKPFVIRFGLHLCRCKNSFAFAQQFTCIGPMRRVKLFRQRKWICRWHSLDLRREKKIIIFLHCIALSFNLIIRSLCL